MNQWELDGNTRDRRQARENACDKFTVGFGWIGGAIFLSQSKSVAKQNDSNSAGLLSTLKRELF